ncbi:HAMP domain-containing histidine kinase, partial [Candidatus Woesearchaeota archaeon]|nr:HAMP domain-containing histidine kinase [Candidatus Woesearchaeota archaeon]
RPLHTDERALGKGLGLWIVREIAELYGGKLEMIGKNEYGGATFRVEMPTKMF